MPASSFARLLLVLSITVWVESSARAGDAPKAAVESTLPTDSDNIRQFAFDGDDSTCFVSNGAPGKDDSFSLIFDSPVTLKSVTVQTGRPDGADALHGDMLQISEDGSIFWNAAFFKEGVAKADSGKRARVIRIRPGSTGGRPLVIREIKIDSQPQVKTFAYPVEYTVNVDDAPEMKDWAENAARTCERWYDPINEQLRSDGYKPIHRVQMILKNGIKVPAMAGGGRITGSVKWFKDHPDDVGAMIHETVHIVQNYHSRKTPGWLVEGVADYIRFFQYEPDNIGRFNPKTARYDGNYRISARFLAHVSEKHDKDLVLKLNQAMRAGRYSEDLFKEYTGKTLPELDEEWRAAIQK